MSSFVAASAYSPGPVSSAASSGGMRAVTGPDRVLRVRAAGRARRWVAAIIDVVLVTIITAGVTLLAALFLDLPLPRARELGPDLLLAGLLDRNPITLGAVGLFVGVSALYQIYLGGIIGQTYGKRAMGLRVISVRGAAPGPARGIMRFMALVISLAPAGIGWAWCLFDRERRSLHDHVAGTYVIVDR